ncbi:uncharacterized protein LOC132729644 [Ruditapes philippinarum]|uniref:uncharacterized protein LOC132729644 n=1 Tax=Ruditapes philippinarum TaxID=129788 RepID=UPI00295B77B4|nr:uncharacterized protein LOC132729644 [Ruditapes philippinarum]
MMGKTRSFQEAMATPFEDKRLLKESRNKEQNKEGGIMEENKIRKRQVMFVGRCIRVQIKQYDTLNMMDVLKGKISELEKRQIEENKIKEAQKGMKEEQGNKPNHLIPLPFERKLFSPEESTLSYSDVMAFQRTLIEWDPFDEKMKISRFLESNLREYLEMFGRNAMKQHTAPQQKEFFFNITKDHGGFDDTEKVRGKRAIFADCHIESRPGQADNLFVVHAECRPKCPFVVNDKKRNAGQTNDVATQTVPVLEPGRNAITLHAAPQQSGKLNDIVEDQCEFDDTEKEIQELDQLLRCKVCLDSDACIVFLPCRHMSTCEYCEGFLHHCPVCRSFIEEAVKINEE